LDSIRETGAEVTSIDPESVTIDAQELELIDANVVPLWTSVQIIGVPTVDPKTVKLEIPKENRHLLPDAITVYAVVSDDALKDMKPNVSREKDASIQFISPLDDLDNKIPLDEFDVKSDPSRVSVRFKIQSKTKTITLQGVNVLIAGPAEYLNEYSITLPHTIGQDVTVEADIELIDRIARKDVTVFAIVQLLARDLGQEITKKSVTTFLAITEDGSGRELKWSVTNPELLYFELKIKKIEEIEKIEEIAE